jgi:hypothetical protein
MMYLVFLMVALLFAGCSSKPSNEIDALAEEVIKRKEGVDIRVTPVDPEKK